MLRPPMRHLNQLAQVVIIVGILGSRPLTATAESVVFYCEVIPEKNETLIAVSEGSVNLKLKAGGPNVLLAADTFRIIKASGQPGKASSVPNHIRALVDIWKDILKLDRPLLEAFADFFGASLWCTTKIDLGDLRPGETVEKQIALPARAITDDLFDAFSIEQEFDVCPGVFLDSRLEKAVQPERTLFVLVSAGIIAEADVHDEQVFKGRLALKTSDPRFNKRNYTMEVSFRASVPEGSESGLTAGNKRFTYLGVLFGVAAIVGGGLYLYRRTPHEPKEKIRGKLSVVHNPTRGDRSINVIDLQLASHALKKQSITFGNGPDADIQLPHKSVKPLHCRIFPVVDRGINKIFITPLDENKIYVNQKKFTMGSYLLQNGAQITIGKFVFDFELTDIYRQIEVWTVDGDLQRGVITYQWDVDAPGFSIILFVDKFSVVQPPSFNFKFSKVKTIRFYKAEEKIHLRDFIPLARRSAGGAIIHFKDGSWLECRLQRGDQTKARHIFALPPKGDTATDYYLIVTKNVKKVEYR